VACRATNSICSSVVHAFASDATYSYVILEVCCFAVGVRVGLTTLLLLALMAAKEAALHGWMTLVAGAMVLAAKLVKPNEGAATRFSPNP